MLCPLACHVARPDTAAVEDGLVTAALRVVTLSRALSPAAAGVPGNRARSEGAAHGADRSHSTLDCVLHSRLYIRSRLLAWNGLSRDAG